MRNHPVSEGYFGNRYVDSIDFTHHNAVVVGYYKAKVKAAQLGVAALFIIQNEKQAFEEVQVGNF